MEETACQIPRCQVRKRKDFDTSAKAAGLRQGVCAERGVFFLIFFLLFVGLSERCGRREKPSVFCLVCSLPLVRRLFGFLFVLFVCLFENPFGLVRFCSGVPIF